MKNRKTIIVAFLLVAAMAIGVGYAALTDTLTIIGNAQIDLAAAENTFDSKVYFVQDSVVMDGNGTGTTLDVASVLSADDATYTVNELAVKDQWSSFTFTIQNDSNVPAVISIESKKLSGDSNPTNSNAEYFTVEYSYGNNDMTIPANGGQMTVTVRVTVAKPVTAATTATFGIELTATTAEPQ
ncbi:MAG: hypothetical protein IKM34_02875 [Clostridia bacterium]|nr:hypothetical protein [Clostridia bacterium]